jgi:hypothetical protein
MSIQFRRETGRLRWHINVFLEVGVQESSDNVHLIYRETKMSCNSEHDTEGGKFDDRREGFFVVDAVDLSEATCNEMCLESFEFIPLIVLHTEHPLACHHLPSFWKVDILKSPGPNK